ncbi:MAG: hypothetical protein ACE5OZ_23800 [Candidatus Heimdallarchaeota archaeon]
MTEKVSFYVDEKLWKTFKDRVFEKNGSLRGLSQELSNLLRESLPGFLYEELKQRVTTDTTAFEPQKIKAGRPKAKVSSTVLLREERDAQC